jgi:hypothetical protein
MLFRIASDLHAEFWQYNKFGKTLNRVLPPLETDKISTLILAGDTGTFHYYKSTYKPLLVALANRFRYVVLVYGNHAWYNSSVWGHEREFWKDKPVPENVFILDDDFKVLDDVVVMGATLWTDFAGGDEQAMSCAQRGMSDFRSIRTGRYIPEADSWMLHTMPPIRPIHTIRRHEVSRQFILDGCRMFRDRKRVVVTHHAPSFHSVHPKYQKDLLSPAFYSDLDEQIQVYGPNLWVHGHMHDSSDYMLGETRVICNPFGYLDAELNPSWNPALLVEV